MNKEWLKLRPAHPAVSGLLEKAAPHSHALLVVKERSGGASNVEIRVQNMFAPPAGLEGHNLTGGVNHGRSRHNL